jgi:hypothetical protein
MKDQAEYFTKALGAGGSRPWMTQNEVRDNVGLGESDDDDADSLKNPLTQPDGGANAAGQTASNGGNAKTAGNSNEPQ